MSADTKPTDAGTVRLSRSGAVATLLFDRPAARNAMTWAMYEELAAHCRRLADDPAVQVTVMRGAGGEAFVAGTDITQFVHFHGGDDGVDYERRIDEGISLIERLPMPSVALVEGWCVGGGLAIATACDFRLAAPGARFAAPIARTLGNTLSVANLARLKDTWGKQRVRRMLLLAEAIGADEALACGAVHALHPAAELDAAAAALCERLAALAPVTQAVTKEALRRLTEAALPAADDLIHLCYGSADFREGVAAFNAKRPPVWRGR
jgi:enoyl-CoA hydratase/carnithine racemase